MSNILLEENAFESLKNYLVKEYKNKKVGLITTEKTLNNYKKHLQIFKNLPLTLNVEFLDEDIICNTMFIEVCRVKVTAYDLVICFENAFINILKIACTKANIPYVIMPNICEAGDYCTNQISYFKDNQIMHMTVCEPVCVFVDYSFLSYSKMHHIAELYAFALSYNILLVQAIYQKEFSEKVCVEFNQTLRGIYLFNNENLKSKMGKIKLFQHLLELQLKCNEYQIFNISNALMLLYQKQDLISNVSSSQGIYIFSLIMLSLHFNIITNKICAPPMNIEKRINRLKLLFDKDDVIISKFTNNILLDKNKQLYTYAKMKNYSEKYIQIGLNRMLSHYSILKNLYIDKGVSFYKINLQKFYQCISLACDIFPDKILQILRDVGIIDLIA